MVTDEFGEDEVTRPEAPLPITAAPDVVAGGVAVMGDRKRVPAPSLGRVVLYRDFAGECMPAIVLAVDADSPAWVSIAALQADVQFQGVALDLRHCRYHESAHDCWFWPPRVDATIEVANSDDSEASK